MTLAYRVDVQGIEKVQRLLKQLKPPASNKAIAAGLRADAKAVQRDATLNQIIRGGKGPVDPKRLTSRSGDLRSSIQISTTRLPKSISVGTFLRYGRAHELGFKGTVQVRAHSRQLQTGRFQVRSHPRRMNIKARPFLKPALDKMAGTFPTLMVREIEKRLPR